MRMGKDYALLSGHSLVGGLGLGPVVLAWLSVRLMRALSICEEGKRLAKKLAQFQYWQFRMAERAIEIENARNLYSKAALRIDQGVEFPEPEAAGAKYYGTECASELARDAVQIFGGYGFMCVLHHDQSTYKVEEIYRDCKITETYEGTNEIQKWIKHGKYSEKS